MAKLKYTFDDYIRNPSGKGSAVVATVNLDQYQKELLSLESKNGKASYIVYRQNNIGGKLTYYIHFKIPSSTKGFFNDVVIQLDANQDDTTTTKTVKAYKVKFFSNDSNFVYTYAYSYKSHGVLITELEKLLPFRCITSKPVMRNPDNAMGYNKDIVFAYIVMTRDDLFTKENLNRNCKNSGINTIRNSIDNFDKKVRERSKITQELKQAGLKEKQIPKTGKVIKSKNLLGSDGTQSPAKLTRTVKSVMKSSVVSRVKKSKKR